MIRFCLISFVLTGNINLIETRNQNGEGKIADQELGLADVIQTLQQLKRQITGEKDSLKFITSKNHDEVHLMASNNKAEDESELHQKPSITEELTILSLSAQKIILRQSLYSLNKENLLRNVNDEENLEERSSDPKESSPSEVIQMLREFIEEINGEKQTDNSLYKPQNTERAFAGNVNYEGKQENLEERSFDTKEMLPSGVMQMLREFIRLLNEEEKPDNPLYKPPNTEREFSTDYIDDLLKRVTEENLSQSHRQRNEKQTYNIFSISSPDLLQIHQDGIKSISDPIKNLPRFIQNLRRIQKDELDNRDLLFREDNGWKMDSDNKKMDKHVFEDIPAKGSRIDDFDFEFEKKPLRPKRIKDNDNWEPKNENRNIADRNRFTTNKFENFLNKPKRFDDYGSKKRDFKSNSNIWDRKNDEPQKERSFKFNNERITVRTTRKREWAPNREANWALKPKPNSYRDNNRAKERNNWEIKPKARYNNHIARGGGEGYGRTAPAYHGKKHIYEDDK